MDPEGNAEVPVEGHGHLVRLSHQECLSLLESVGVGRVAVALPGEPPLVVPVNFALRGDVVVFRTDPGSKLFALRQQPASFQADAIDSHHHTGWSVLVQGIAYEATATEVESMDVHLLPWAGGEKRHWIKIIPASITGRRIVSSPIQLDERGYL